MHNISLSLPQIRALLVMIETSENMAHDYSQSDEELEDTLTELDALRDALDPNDTIRRL